MGDEVGLQYYRLERVSCGAIELRDGDALGVRIPTDVGTGKPKEEKVPLSEIITVLNDRGGSRLLGGGLGWIGYGENHGFQDGIGVAGLAGAVEGVAVAGFGVAQGLAVKRVLRD